jgi:hypothetical protein
MRDGIAQAVAVAAADAVRAMTRVLLGTAASGTPSESRTWTPAPRSALWDEPEDLHGEDRFSSFHDEEEENSDNQLDATPQPASTSQAPVRKALAVGCAAAAFWLRRAVGNGYVLATLGVGLVCTAVAYLVGAQLAESVLSLAALADTLRSGTALFTRIATS